MRKKITTFFDHIKTYISHYVTLTTAIGILWGCFIIYHNWTEHNKYLKTSVDSISNSQNKLQKTDSLLLDSQLEIRKEIDALKTNIETNTEKLNSLEKSYIKYISNDAALTKSDFLKYMEGLTIDSKKKINDLINYTEIITDTLAIP